jgi:hypothetical protein
MRAHHVAVALETTIDKLFVLDDDSSEEDTLAQVE